MCRLPSCFTVIFCNNAGNGPGKPPESSSTTRNPSYHPYAPSQIRQPACDGAKLESSVPGYGDTPPLHHGGDIFRDGDDRGHKPQGPGTAFGGTRHPHHGGSICGGVVTDYPPYYGRRRGTGACDPGEYGNLKPSQTADKEKAGLFKEVLKVAGRSNPLRASELKKKREKKFALLEEKKNDGLGGHGLNSYGSDRTLDQDSPWD